MSVTQNYLEGMKNIQKNLLDFLDNQTDIEEKFQNLKMLLDELKILDDSHKLRSFLHLLLKISNNHHRTLNFFSKIEQILQLFKNIIKKYFLNSEIFNIFKSNKRILLFLIEEKIIEIDEYIIKNITKRKYLAANYPQYFQPEIKLFIHEKMSQKNENYAEISNELPSFFYENRKIGENDNKICQLIRKDLVEEFISYVNRNNILLDSKIETSIYETNPFLIKKKAESQNNDIRLIEYASFYGSIQIFNYLKMNGVKLTPSLWNYAMHGRNTEIIHLLEENNIDPEYQSFQDCLEESIKCHHIDLTKYIQENHYQNEEDNSHDTFSKSLKYYNFVFIQNDFINQSSFYDLCQYDYYILIDDLLKSKNININKRIVNKN